MTVDSWILQQNIAFFDFFFYPTFYFFLIDANIDYND